MTTHRSVLIVMAASCTAAPTASADYYEATLTGTITYAEFYGPPPAPLAGIAVGQTYTYVVRTELDPSFQSEIQAAYAGLSSPMSSLHIDDGSPSGIDVPMSNAIAYPIETLYLPNVIYSLNTRVAIAGTSLYAGAAVGSNTPPLVQNNTGLLLDFDESLLVLEGFYIGADPATPSNVAGTVDTFSARIVPSPGVAGVLALFGVPLAARRRRA